VSDPVVDHESGANFVKVSLVKDQEILILIRETLDGVGGSLWEVPDVPVVENLFLVSAVLINGRDKNRPVVYEAPFGLLQLVSIQLERRTVELTTRCQ
jgi:hypothetical protein